MGEIIKFQLNLGVELPGLRMLNGNFGKLVDSQKYKKGDGSPQQQYQFSTTDNRVFWVPDFAGMQIHDQITRLQIQEGEPLKITKAEVPQVGRKAITRWLVERIGEAAPPAASSSPSQPTGPAKLPPVKVPYNIALREILKFTTDELKAAGEQWSDQSREGLVCTLFIQASKDGFLTLWERTAQTELEQQLRDSIVAAAQAKQQQQPQPPQQQQQQPALPAKAEPVTAAAAPHVSGGTTTNRKPWSDFKGMINAFAAIKRELPTPDIYYHVLGRFNLQHANQFKNESTAWTCYQQLEAAVRDFRRKAANPETYEHHHAHEGSWTA